MKRILLILSFISFYCSYGQEVKPKIQWMTMSEAIQAQKKKPKKILVDFYTTWCGPCKLMNNNTFENNDVADYINENYYPVKFNAEGTEVVKYKGKEYKNPNYQKDKAGRNSPHEFAMYMGINSFPTLAFYDEQSDYITPIVGYLTPTQLEPFLKIFATNDYKKVDSKEKFEEWKKQFKSVFKE